MHAGGRLDLRPRNPKPRTLDVSIAEASPRADFTNLRLERPAITYDGPRAERDSSELFSAAREWLDGGMRLLDLGCGPRDQATPAKHLGLEYVGIDFDSRAADLLADAHAIPFQDASFDGVLSYAVLEHLYNPFLAAREVARVLRPGGVFFGTVSQGEPFHDSFFHHTAWGVDAAFRAAGLRLVRLWPSYDTLNALAGMGRYARVTRVAIKALHAIDRATPFLAPRLYFRGTRRDRELNELHRAASLCFVAVIE